MKFLLTLLSVLVLFCSVSVVAAQGQNEVAGTVLFVRENPEFNQANFQYNQSTDQFGGAISYSRFAKTKPIGITFEVADTATGSSATDANLATATVGVTIKSRTAKVAPFLRGSIGIARLAARNQLLSFNRSDTGLAFIAGGGLDVQLSKVVSIRVIEVDYLGTRVFSDVVPHVRVGSGLVFRF